MREREVLNKKADEVSSLKLKALTSFKFHYMSIAIVVAPILHDSSQWQSTYQSGDTADPKQEK